MHYITGGNPRNQGKFSDSKQFSTVYDEISHSCVLIQFPVSVYGKTESPESSRFKARSCRNYSWSSNIFLSTINLDLRCCTQVWKANLAFCTDFQPPGGRASKHVQTTRQSGPCCQIRLLSILLHLLSRCQEASFDGGGANFRRTFPWDLSFLLCLPKRF